ncbi:MAG: type II secretion system major pseudopilin GspG [Verrucomicrobiota bacterium]|jgi:general secretion pathway protein G|nr:type II secretion system major pseudopilin GspG [Verrucomicrobiaceae bacterium]MDH4452671.1 type II secretion system major pseudopilin GspG [Verrucomicrobiota bacterium]
MKHTQIQPRHSTSGFTLVEMILVLAIVALLVGAAVVNFGGVLEGGKKTTSKGHISGIISALRAYEVDNMFLPTTQQGLSALVEKPSGRPAPQSWSAKLKKLPIDPWGNPYHYRRPGTKDKGGFDVYSAGPDGVPDNADDIGSWDI